jgi:hypothetical protein
MVSLTNLPLTQSLEIQSYLILGELCFLVEWVVYAQVLFLERWLQFIGCAGL